MWANFLPIQRSFFIWYFFSLWLHMHSFSFCFSLCLSLFLMSRNWKSSAVILQLQSFQHLVNCMLWSELSFSLLAHAIYGKLWTTLLLWMNNHAAQDAVKVMILNWLKKASLPISPIIKRIKSRITQSFRGTIQFEVVLIQWYLWILLSNPRH